MLQITYSPADAGIAGKMQQDLSRANFQPEQAVLIVLLSPNSVTDSEVLNAVEHALSQDTLIVLVLLQKCTVPDMLRRYKHIDLTDGYDSQKFMYRVRRALVEHRTKWANRRLLIGLLLIVIFVFSVAVWSISTGIIAFPKDEFATENALQQQMIETYTYPTLNPLMPRTTEDALAFPRTVEAANTRNAPLLRATASALPRDRQATQDAIATSADLTLTARAEATQTASGE